VRFVPVPVSAIQNRFRRNRRPFLSPGGRFGRLLRTKDKERFLAFLLIQPDHLFHQSGMRVCEFRALQTRHSIPAIQTLE